MMFLHAFHKGQFCLLIVFVSFLLTGCKQETKTYYTWDGIGPDKWAAIWLIKTHIDPQANIQLVPIGSTLREGIAFDVPFSDFNRDSRTTFSKLIERYQLKDPALLELSQIVTDIEILSWSPNQNEASTGVENQYRNLQKKLGWRSDEQTCFLQFFTQVHGGIVTRQLTSFAFDPTKNCAQKTRLTAEHNVPEIGIKDVFDAMSKGKKVVFLDAREEDEFAELHIPGAENIKMRDITAEKAAQFKNADLVVPYCVKDFRGYEVARLLGEHGLTQTAIMNPFGLNGWKSLNLPLAGQLASAEADAIAQLNRCAKGEISCL